MFIPIGCIAPQYLRHKRPRLFILVVILFLFRMGISLAVDNNIPNDKNFSGVDLKNGLLRVSVENQSFKDIMDEIAKKAEIKIIIDYPYEEEITTSFDYLPLEKGLRKLLREKNYAFQYQFEEGNDSKASTGLSKVFVFSRSEEVTVAESEGLVKDWFRDNAMQVMAMNELQDQIRAKLDEVLVLQDLPQSGLDIEKQLREAIIKERGIFEEMAEFEGVADIEEQVKAALQMMQGKEDI